MKKGRKEDMSESQAKYSPTLQINRNINIEVKKGPCVVT